MDGALQRLLDKDAIRECLMRYARGIDRFDRTVLESVYWPDATDRHLSFAGSAIAFLDFAFNYARTMRTQHLLGNILIEFVDGATANVETYYVAAHERAAPGGCEDFVVHGRYLDRFSKRGEEWRILERTLTCDLYSVRASTADWASGPFSGSDQIGGHHPHDPLYRIFKPA